MGWTAPRTWVDEEFVDETLMNTHIKDNQAYLKSSVETHKTVTRTNATASRAIDGTVYQNTSGKYRYCTITCYADTAQVEGINIYCDADNPPTTLIAAYLGIALYQNKVVPFFVPPGYYYKVDYNAATPGWGLWFEYDLF